MGKGGSGPKVVCTSYALHSRPASQLFAAPMWRKIASCGRRAVGVDGWAGLPGWQLLWASPKSKEWTNRPTYCEIRPEVVAIVSIAKGPTGGGGTDDDDLGA